MAIFAPIRRIMIAFIFFILFIPVFALGGVYAERKVSAFIQDRMGPMEVGFKGTLQTAADILKLLMKEDIVPLAADRKLFLTAPILVFTAIFAGFAVVPFTSSSQNALLETGIYYVLAIISLDVIGILMAGWGSNSKFSMYGAMRSVAQLVSYEIPLGLSVLCVVVFTQTLNLQEISLQQGIYQATLDNPGSSYFFGIPGLNTSAIGGFLSWNIFRMPLLMLVFVIFFIASLAECNRAPFDLPESESELVGGYHTEYSGFRWAILMLSEYGMMLLVSILAVVLFLGSWNTPLPNIGPVRLADWSSGEPGTLFGIISSGFWLLSKALVLIFLQMTIRWTYPRLRVDQLMSLAWKYLIPATLVLLFLIAAWKLLLVG